MSEIKIGDWIKVTAGTYYNHTGNVVWIESGLPQFGTKYKVILDDGGNEVDLYEDNIKKLNEGVFIENVRNNLPAWSDEFLPEKTRQHIKKRHTYSGRLRDLFDDYYVRRAIIGRCLSDKATAQQRYNELKERILTRLEAGETLKREESEIVEYARTIISKEPDLFPYPMNEKQIIRAVKEAYLDAQKIGSKHRTPTKRDKDNVDKPWHLSLLYQGNARELIIHFWFDFNVNQIDTAYPVYS
jgi:hypothetical protein